jgi:hypothetical protein
VFNAHILFGVLCTIFVSGDVYNSMSLQHHQLSLQQQQQQQAQQINAYGHNNQSSFRDPNINFSTQAQPPMVVPPYLSSPTFGTLNAHQGFGDELEGEVGGGGMYGGNMATALPLSDNGQVQQSGESTQLTSEGKSGAPEEQMDSNQLSQAFEQLSTSSPTPE